MMEQSYLRLLILCIVLSQGIAVSLNENIEGSSNIHIRQKRVVDRTKNGGLPQQLTRAHYIVNVLKDNISECAASILSDIFLITVTQCIYPSEMERYSILSGSARRDNGTRHNIVKRILYRRNLKIALVQISPPIDLQHSLNGIISLFIGLVPDSAYGTFSGWGCTRPGDMHIPTFPEQLIQTRLPIIPTLMCRHIYRQRFPIAEEDICTLDTSKRRGTCIGDLGGPLVYDNRLLGMMSVIRGINFGEDPDVFTCLNHLDIHQWVTNTIQNHFHH